MDDSKLRNLLEDIEDFNLPMTKCDDLQKIINYCQENYDYWREIKLCYSFFYNHDQSIFFDINDFNLDNKNRVLELICDDNKDSSFTILSLEKLLNFITDYHLSTKRDFFERMKNEKFTVCKLRENIKNIIILN